MKDLLAAYLDEQGHTQAKKDAWEHLKTRFYLRCQDKRGWTVNDRDMTITHLSDNGCYTGVSSEVFTFWRNKR